MLTSTGKRKPLEEGGVMETEEGQREGVPRRCPEEAGLLPGHSEEAAT